MQYVRHSCKQEALPPRRVACSSGAPFSFRTNLPNTATPTAAAFLQARSPTHSHRVGSPARQAHLFLSSPTFGPTPTPTATPTAAAFLQAGSPTPPVGSPARQAHLSPFAPASLTQPLLSCGIPASRKPYPHVGSPARQAHLFFLLNFSTRLGRDCASRRRR